MCIDIINHYLALTVSFKNSKIFYNQIKLSIQATAIIKNYLQFYCFKINHSKIFFIF